MLIAGASMSLPRPEVAHMYTYPGLLQRKAKMLPRIEVNNISEYGQSMEGAYQSLVTNLPYIQPNVVILHVGLAECWPRKSLNGNPRTDLKSFSFSYYKIIKLMKRKKLPLRIISISPTSIKMNKKYPKALALISQYNKVLSRGSLNQDIYFIDLAKYIKVEQPNVYLLQDDQHFNKRGHRLLYKLVWDLLMKITIKEKKIMQ